MIYYIVFFILLSSSIAEIVLNKKIKILYIMNIIVLILFASLRWEIGTDWSNYYWNFVSKRSLHEMLLSEFEKGFQVWSFFIQRFTLKYNIFLFFHIGIAMIFIGYIILKNVKYLNFALLCFYASSGYMDYFGGIRAAFANSILFFSLKYIKEKNIYKFLGCVVFASYFHRTALIFIFAYFVYYLNLDKCKIIILFILALIIMEIDILNRVLNIIGNLNLAMISQKIKLYLNVHYIVPNIKKYYLILSILKRGIVILPVIYMYKKLDIRIKRIFNLYFFSIIIYILGSSNENLKIFQRLSIYYLTFECLLFARLFESLKFSKKILFFISIVILLFLKLYYHLNTGYSDLFIPYRTFIEVGSI